MRLSTAAARQPERHRAATPRRVPPRPGRDLRLDALRGWLQLTIFMAHAALVAPGSTRIGGWIVHTAWGYSDSSEQFIFTSGLGLGSVFALKYARDGLRPALGDILRRTLRLYRAHLMLFAAFGALVLLGAFTLGFGDDLPRMGWDLLDQQPARALLLIPPLIYQPQFMEILPVFIVCTLLVGPFMWLVERAGDAALVVPFALYAATHAFGLTLPAIGPEGYPHWGFNPFGWQLLYLLGAWLGRRSLLTQGRAVPHHPALVVLCVVILAWGFFVRIATYGWWPQAWLPFGWIPALDWLIIKENLGPVLVIHGLAIAYLCATCLPRDAAWLSRGIGPYLTGVGRHSLQAYCVGLCLSWAVAAVLRLVGYSYVLDAALLIAGCAVILLMGRELDRRRVATPASAPAR